MANDDWFRRTTWSSKDREEFFSRLKRSRTSYNKAQYVRIQAHYLASVGTEPLIRDALELLDYLFANYPERSQLSSAHFQRAKCLTDLGDYPLAIDAYRNAFEFQRKYPGWQTNAHGHFAELIVTLKRRDLYDEALAILDEFGESDVFPVDVFKREAARALIAEDRGDQARAADHARRALAAAAATDSGFRYHKRLGLVGFVDPDVTDRLRSLSAA